MFSEFCIIVRFCSVVGVVTRIMIGCFLLFLSSFVSASLSFSLCSSPPPPPFGWAVEMHAVAPMKQQRWPSPTNLVPLPPGQKRKLVRDNLALALPTIDGVNVVFVRFSKQNDFKSGGAEEKKKEEDEEEEKKKK